MDAFTTHILTSEKLMDLCPSDEHLKTLFNIVEAPLKKIVEL